jgi:hypothetical protein
LLLKNKLSSSQPTKALSTVQDNIVRPGTLSLRENTSKIHYRLYGEDVFTLIEKTSLKSGFSGWFTDAKTVHGVFRADMDTISSY